MIGGYWIFNKKLNEFKFVPIISGIVIGYNLLKFVNYFFLIPDSNLEAIPIPNLLLCLGLGISLFKVKGNRYWVHSRILMRSSIIALVSCFFAYIPLTSDIKYNALLLINQSNQGLMFNINMHKYRAESLDAFEVGDSKLALDMAIKSNLEGIKWHLYVKGELEVENLEVQFNSESDSLVCFTPTDHFFIPKEDLEDISGTFSHLYRAYRRRGNEYLDDNNQKQAIEQYRLGDLVINSVDHHYLHWELEKAESANRIGNEYLKQGSYTRADTFLVLATERYLDIRDTLDAKFCEYMGDLAYSFSLQNEDRASNLLYRKTLPILEQDTASKDLFLSHTRAVIQNSLKMDSLDEAKKYIDNALPIIDGSSLNYCNFNLLNAIYLYRKDYFNESKIEATKCLDCFRDILGETHGSIVSAYYFLSMIDMALANYDDAKVNIDKGLELVQKIDGFNTSNHANFTLLSANLAKLTGEYQRAKAKYKQSIKIYHDYYGKYDAKLAESYIELADLEVTLSEPYNAANHKTEALMNISELQLLETIAMNSVFNHIAYVDYYLGNMEESENRYKRILSINEDFNRTNSISSASAKNGLGLIYLRNKKFRLSENNFSSSLKISGQILGESHPFIGTVYLNYAELKIQQGEYNKAEEFLTKSLKINKTYFDENHDVFGDLYFTFGDLAFRRKRKTKAKEYFQMAHEIYKGKFDTKHTKVKQVRNRLLLF
jgi:tetratricopeptide (TPR) repeat protein